MLYVVTGLGRSGTSMMMNALANGGLDAEFTPKGSDKWVGDYHPNRDGYFELRADQVKLREFPKPFDGKLIKVPFHKIRTMHIIPMRVVFMKRDFDEVRISYKKLNEHRAKQSGITLERHILEMNTITSYLERVSDDYIEIWYKDVLENPLECFEAIRSHGFPIDPVKCAEIPEKGLCHF